MTISTKTFRMFKCLNLLNLIQKFFIIYIKPVCNKSKKNCGIFDIKVIKNYIKLVCDFLLVKCFFLIARVNIPVTDGS